MAHQFRLSASALRDSRLKTDKSGVLVLDNKFPRRPIRINFDLGGNTPPTLSVKGRVLLHTGAPQGNRLVKAVDVDVRTEKVIGTATTGADGAFSISYSSSDLKRSTNASADLKLYTFELGSDQVAGSTAVFWDADKDVVVDIVVGASVVDEQSEFQAVQQSVLRALGSVRPEDVVDDETHDDLTYLINTTGLDRNRIEHFIAANKQQAATGLTPETLYGLYRQGQSPEPKILLGRSSQLLKRSLRLAAGNNIVSLQTDEQIAAILSSVKTAAIAEAIQPANSASLSPLGSVLATATPEPKLFFQLYSDFDGSKAEDFWTSLEARPEFEGRVPVIQQAIQLGGITLSHVPLIRELQGQLQTNTLQGLPDLSKFSPKQWEALVQRPNIGVPPEIPGADASERARVYASTISSIVEAAFPAQYVAHRLQDADDDEAGTLQNKPPLVQFLQQNPDFDFTTTRVSEFAAKKPTAFEGIQNATEVRELASSLQRVYSVAGTYAHARPLLANGIHSAVQISRMGRSAFVARFGQSLGDRAQALVIFERAEQISATAVNLLMEFGNLAGQIRLPVFKGHEVSYSDIEGGIPDIATLFGRQDSCSCDSCRAVDGPAAYLVDILHFLADRKLIDPLLTTRDASENISTVVIRKRLLNGQPTAFDMSAKDALFERRPDIGAIELSCQNTNTPVPYIDLALEVLENAVSPLPPFEKQTLPRDSIADLDRLVLPPSLRAQFNPPLSDFATVTVRAKGSAWTIDETAFTYTLKETAAGVEITSRSKQTKGTSTERATAPMYVNPAAYTVLKDQVYPSTLPFDQWLETVRTFLLHMDVRRHELMAVFDGSGSEVVLARGDIACERLGISTFEASIITGRTTAQPNLTGGGVCNFYGLRSSVLSGRNVISDPADKTKVLSGGFWVQAVTSRLDVFLQQTSLTYAELRNLLQFSNVFGSTQQLAIEAVLATDKQTCNLSKLKLVGTTEQVLHSIHRFIRLLRKTGLSVIELGSAIIVFKHWDNLEGVDKILLALSHMIQLKESLNLPILTLLSFWAPISSMVYIDHENDDEDVVSRSEFARIFCNPTVVDSRDAVFTGKPESLRGRISDHKSTISAALRQSAADVQMLLSDARFAGGEQLSIESVSMMYRHSTLATALGITIPNYLSLLKLHGSVPFASTNDTAYFVARTKALADSRVLSIPDLDFLLRHDFAEVEGAKAFEDGLAVELRSLSVNLKEIRDETTLDLGANQDLADIVRTKLGQMNWEADIVTEIVAVLGGLVSFAAPIAAPLPDTFIPAAAIKDRFTYSEAQQTITFSGMITKADQDVFLESSTGVFEELKSAVEIIFRQPRDLLLRHLRTFASPSISINLDALPNAVKIPSSMKKKLTFNAADKMLSLNGVLSQSDRLQLLTNTDAATDANYIRTINTLYDFPLSMSVSPEDSFLAPSDVEAMFDSSMSGADLVASRFMAVLDKLLPALRTVLRNQLLVRSLGQDLEIGNELVSLLIHRWVKVRNEPMVHLFSDSAFAQDSETSVINRAAFPAQFHALSLLKKVALLISRLGLTKRELTWFYEYRTEGFHPPLGWLDLNNLPTVLLPPDTKPDLTGLERLLALLWLRNTLPGGSAVQDWVFTNIGGWEDTHDKFIDELCSRTKWSAVEIKQLVGPGGIKSISFPNSYRDETGLSAIARALALLKKMGTSAVDGTRFAQPDQSEADARTIVQIVKAKYDEGTWSGVGRSLRNILRESQRKALVAFLLARQSSAALGWRHASDISAHYLVDVEMGPCQLTSRIKQAISSTQTFVQRCFMNLEKGVVVDAEWDSRWDEWKTLKSFALTSAARKVFMHPENYLEPGIRDDKSPIFKELEEELQQNETTHDVAEQALLRYLDKLEEVSHLQVVSFYHQQEDDQPRTMDVLHVFARSCSQPLVYYYRKRVDGFQWTAWERITVEISGDHLVPVIWKRRLYLFWAQFIEKPEKGKVSITEIISGSPFYELRLAWSERKNGKWLAKTTTSSMLLVYGGGPFAIDPTDPVATRGTGPSLYTFRTEGGGNTNFLKIQCLQNTLNNLPYMGYFQFDDMKTDPFVVEQWRTYVGQNQYGKHIGLLEPNGTVLRNMGFQEVPELEHEEEHGVYVYHNEFSPDSWMQNSQSIKKQARAVRLLTKSPGTFTLVRAHQDHQFGNNRPFFFQHSNLSFFVEPVRVTSRSTHRWQLLDPKKAVVGMLNGRHFASVLDKPRVVAPSRPIPGLTNTIQSFEIYHGTTANLIEQPVTSLLNLSDALPGASFASGINGFGRPRLAATAEFRTLSTGRKLGVVNHDLLEHTLLDTSTKYKFSVFYHPYVPDFIRHLNRDGVDTLMSRPLQLSSNPTFFKDSYGDKNPYVLASAIPTEEVEMDNGAMSQYNWELFYHVPLLIAEKLSKNQRFAEAQKWFHYVFDPTDTSSAPAPQRFWQTKKFFQTSKEDVGLQAIQSLFQFLASRGSGSGDRNLSPAELERLEALQKAIRMWRKDPFNPYLVARTRSAAFQMSVVMMYLDNLLAWGDQLFRMDTMESMNEATQIFTLAEDILGDRPVEMASGSEPVVHTYDEIEPYLDGMSNFNALQRIEELLPSPDDTLVAPQQRQNTATPTILYFCVPRNEKLMGYWDVVSDRLFKIRNCMNLQGIVRELALFEPPLDPAMLIKASAAGLDMGSALSDISAPLPLYRYSVMAGRAMEICNELQQLGTSLLAAIERRDAEAVSLLQSTSALRTLDAARAVKVLNIEDAKANIVVLEQTKTTMEATKKYYSSRLFINQWEFNQFTLQDKALDEHDIEAMLHWGAAAAALIPDIKVGGPTTIGGTWGGSSLANVSSHTGAYLSIKANKKATQAGMSGTLGGHVRRFEDWMHQTHQAELQMLQADKQIEAAKIRLRVADQELKNHDLQVKNARDHDDFIRTKFTNKELHDWMVGQVSALYFQSYQMAYDIAKRAERCYVYELGLDKADFIQFGYWDGLKKGLLAGNKLAHDLRRLNLSYLEQDRREYEISRSISLSQLDPVAFLQLKATGECSFTVPEQIFDIDFPGHYFRRLKTVSLSIPALVGPYTSLSSTLTLLKSSVRTNPSLSGKAYSRRDNDIRFRDMFSHAQSIVTSTAQEDPGIFNVNLQDDRYLPFERAGVISTWKLQFPPVNFCAFDIEAIPDVILHFKYTAREAGEPLRSQAVAEVRKTTLDLIGRAEGASGQVRMISLRHECPDAWHRLFHSGTDVQETRVSLGRDRFPFLLRGAKELMFVKVDFFVRLRRGAELGSLTASFTEAVAMAPSEAVSLLPWNSCLRATKNLGKPAGEYKFILSRDAGPVPPGDIEDIVGIVMIVNWVYVVTWSLRSRDPRTSISLWNQALRLIRPCENTQLRTPYNCVCIVSLVKPTDIVIVVQYQVTW